MRVGVSTVIARARRIREEESGATLVFVALALVALLGMFVLVVDLGGLVGEKRRVVTAADAAALAAAQSCARGEVWEAASQADRFAAQNRAGATRTRFVTNNCGGVGPGSVSVRYEAHRDLLFAPILGLEKSGTVSAGATAMWEPVGGAIAIPIEVSTEGSSFRCMSQPIGSQCNYWHDNDPAKIANSSNWGFLNLGQQWNVSAGASCHNPGASRIRSWIHTGLEVYLNPSGPTYVCMSQGHEHSSWFHALAGEIGQIKVFPVNDPGAAIRTPGHEKYAIVGFAALRIQGVLSGNDPAALAACPGHEPDANAVCVVATWEGPRLGGIRAPGGRDFGLRTVRLSE